MGGGGWGVEGDVNGPPTAASVTKHTCDTQHLKHQTEGGYINILCCVFVCVCVFEQQGGATFLMPLS